MLRVSEDAKFVQCYEDLYIPFEMLKDCKVSFDVCVPSACV
jgi:hypothetical protein